MDNNGGEMLPRDVGLRPVEVESIGDAKGASGEHASDEAIMNSGQEDAFGHSVALSGDTLAVGAHDEDSAALGVGGNQDDDSAPDSGAVYIFH